jgi:photosystem II stability/assembly factor-like uncharacterized protein
MQNTTRNIHRWLGIFLLMMVPLFAQEGTFQFLGLPGQHITAIAVHPDNDSILYVGNDLISGSLFKSNDAGATWDTLLDSVTVRDIDINPLYPDTIYVDRLGGILKTIDGGTTWTHADSGIDLFQVEGFIQTLAIHPTSPETLYAGTAGCFGGNLYRSVNGGLSWTEMDTGSVDERIGLYDGVIEIAFDPIRPDTMYAGTIWSGEIYKTTDGGSTWVALNTPWSDGPGIPFTIALNPNQPNIIYAGVSGYGLMKSTDGGLAWTHKESGMDGNATAIQVIVIDQSNPKQMYAGLNSVGVFETTNGGENWNAINAGLENQGVTSLALTERTLYAGTYDGLYKREHITSVEEPKNLPRQFFLGSNYPNPSNNQTTIQYWVPQGSQVSLVIYNLQGQIVRHLVNGYHTSGEYEKQWDGKNNQGLEVPSGIYLYRLRAGEHVFVKKLTLLK